MEHSMYPSSTVELAHKRRDLAPEPLKAFKAFSAVNPDVRLFAMEPSESCTILCGEIAAHTIEGISDGFVPGIFQRHAGLVNEVLSVSSTDAVAEMKRLARTYGLFCGPELRRAPAGRQTHPAELPGAEDRGHGVLRRGREVPARVLHAGLPAVTPDVGAAQFQ